MSSLFDIITGSGTGAIVAGYLISKRMRTKHCIELFEGIADKLFPKDRINAFLEFRSPAEQRVCLPPVSASHSHLHVQHQAALHDALHRQLGEQQLLKLASAKKPKVTTLNEEPLLIHESQASDRGT